MAEPKENLQMEKIVSLCKRRGFIFQSSEIYGGINGFWDYGPLGTELKRNVKELWWNSMTRQRDDVAGLEATIIMSPAIWKASGHVDTFADLMVECPVTKRRFRADQVDSQTGTAFYFSGAYRGDEETAESAREHGLFLSQKILKLAEKIATIQGEKPLNSLKPHEQAEVEILHSRLREVAVETGKAFEKSNTLETEFEEREKQFQELSFLAFKLDESGHHFAQEVSQEIERAIHNEQKCSKPIGILVKNLNQRHIAIERAKQFYVQQGVTNPIVVGERMEQVENTQRFNPENGYLLSDPRPFNLMFKTYVGPVESEDSVAYLRPETAQAIFAQFKNVLETSRQKVPFGIGQIGKAFRNEVTPRNYTFRSREFEQMELEFFIKPDEAIEAIYGSVITVPETGHPGEPQPNWGWQAWHQYWVEERVRFYEGIGLSRETLGFHRQTPDELAHYARACVDILFKFPFSKRDEKGELKGEELEGIAARSDFDLSQHQRFSGKPMGVFDDELRTAWAKLPKEKQDDLWRRFYENRKKYLTKSAKPEETAEEIQKQATEDANALAKGNYIPHVIEPSAGVDRLILALIANAYSETTKTDDKGKSETTYVMKFHPRVAPVKVGVLPLLKNKPELVKKALAVRDELRPWMNVYYDDGGSIGKRYARQDEAGTPFCVTIDFDTLGEKPELLDTVTIRFRDDGRQERLKICELRDFLLSKTR